MPQFITFSVWKNKHWEAWPYSDAVNKYSDSRLDHLNTETQKKMYAIRFGKEPGYLYVLMDNDKIRSIMPLMKGENVIIGWI